MKWFLLSMLLFQTAGVAMADTIPVTTAKEVASKKKLVDDVLDASDLDCARVIPKKNKYNRIGEWLAKQSPEEKAIWFRQNLTRAIDSAQEVDVNEDGNGKVSLPALTFIRGPSPDLETTLTAYVNTSYTGKIVSIEVVEDADITEEAAHATNILKPQLESISKKAVLDYFLCRVISK